MTLTDYLVIACMGISVLPLLVMSKWFATDAEAARWRGLYYRELGQREVLERWNTWLKVRLDLAAGLSEDEVLRDDEEEEEET